jgi:AraC-like DNA-binding protein
MIFGILFVRGDPMNPVNFMLRYFVHKPCGPSWRLSRQFFPLNGLLLVLEGGADYVIDGVPYSVKAGDLVFMPPGCTREATTTGMTCAAFDFDTAESFKLPTVSPFVVSEELLRLIRSFQYEWLQQSTGKDLKCAAVFLLILHCLLYGDDIAEQNHHVEKMKRYIVRHFADPITRAELAAHVGLSTVYCGALFRQTEGITVAEYLSRIRIREAAALIDEDAHSLAEIADLCGFSDFSYFSNTFKRVMGASPSQYKTRPSAAFVQTEQARHLERLRD